MISIDLSFSAALNPSFSSRKLHHYRKTLKPYCVPKTLIHFRKPIQSISVENTDHFGGFRIPCGKPDLNCRRHCDRLPPLGAGRSKKLPSTGRILGNADVRREAKRNARRKSRKLAESLFYRLKNPHKNHPDNFSEDELQMIGLGYDRMVRFMSKDDPNLKHPYDWYKYGEFGPYSWRGVVVGDPVRGRFSDECAHIMGTVKDHEEWDEIEKHDMAVDFGGRMRSMSKEVGLQNFWVFVRHPKWRLSDLPWEQWTLVCEVVLEAGNERLDKWSLMGRLGNKTREMITRCAAWMRPDIIYVKKPVYQCRFEPQVNFFKALLPLLDPQTEADFMFELKGDDGRVELCTYFGGLCKIVRISQKAFVDDVVNAYEKMSDERKSRCLEFLLMNHPVQLLHPYTKEWKARLEEMELGCDAPDDEDDGGIRSVKGEKEFTDWAEEGGDEENDEGEEDDYVLDEEEDESEPSGEGDVDEDPEEDAEYWRGEFKKAISSNAVMEKLVKRSVEKSTAYYNKQLKEMEEAKMKRTETVVSEDNGDKSARETVVSEDDGDESAQETVINEYDGDETAMRGKRAKVSPEEWKVIGLGRWRKRVKKSRIPPELFLRAAVRPFTYRMLVKEIVLTRHAIIDGDIGPPDK
ncbi:hypothetical protein RND81_09G010900 [Saponaria officinalis]|uniref:Uncharacterized protein n=1 Tax=Saponaria officinalis TaxID=3572 RepID=A0AAW1IHF5_SAPOF